MKKTLRFLTLSIAVLIGIAALAVPTFAQDPSPQDEECNKIYNERFLINRTDKQPQARKDAQEYLDKCLKRDEKIDDYLTKWVIKYDWLLLKENFRVANATNDYPNIYKYGREILAKDSNAMAELVKLKVATGDEPFYATIRMGYAGYSAEANAKNTAYRNDATNYAKTAIQMLDSGKTLAEWKPFKDKDDTAAWLCFGVGYMWREASPKEAVLYFYKSLSYNSPFKTSAPTYYFISTYYSSEYKKVNDVIKSKCVGVPDNDECKALDNAQDAWMDRWADALARAIKLGASDPAAKDWNATLKAIFKERYNTEEGVTEYVNKVQSKPIPDPSTKPEPTPVREVKQEATTTTDTKPATVSTTTTDVAMGNGNGTTTKADGTATKGTTATTGTTTTPAKKAPAPAKGKGGKKKPK